jgi:hypothetical protein
MFDTQRSLGLAVFLLAGAILLSPASPGESQELDACTGADGCSIPIVYSPQTRTLAASKSPVLIPGDRLSIRVVGDSQAPRSLGAWDCVWWTTEGFIFTHQVRHTQTLRPTGLLGQQIRLSALLMNPAGQSEKLGEFSARQAALPERVMVRRQHLQLAGTVSLAPPKENCSMTEQPPADSWYEVQVRIVRAGL